MGQPMSLLYSKVYVQQQFGRLVLWILYFNTNNSFIGRWQLACYKNEKEGDCFQDDAHCQCLLIFGLTRMAPSLSNRSIVQMFWFSLNMSDFFVFMACEKRDDGFQVIRRLCSLIKMKCIQAFHIWKLALNNHPSEKDTLDMIRSTSLSLTYSII